MIVAIHQPNYIPWLGYFHKIKSADCFVILDNVQLPGKGLANRNYIKGKNGTKVLLTVPLKRTNGVKSTYNQAVPDYSKAWQKDHLNKIKDAYFKTPNFEDIFWRIEKIILTRHDHFSALSTSFIQAMCKLLEINTSFVLASSLPENELQKNERNIALCLHLHAQTYLSGQGAKKYNDEALFTSKGINIIYQSFNSPVYKQKGNDFIPDLSVLDILFNLEPEEVKRMLAL